MKLFVLTKLIKINKTIIDLLKSDFTFTYYYSFTLTISSCLKLAEVIYLCIETFKAFITNSYYQQKRELKRLLLHLETF